MKLLAHKEDGRLIAVQCVDVFTYSQALDAARKHLLHTPTTERVYLQADKSPRVVRTYVRTNDGRYPGGVEVLNGKHDPQPVMFPGEFLFGPGTPIGWGDPRDDLVQLTLRDRTDWRDLPVRLTGRAFDNELAEADRKGYNRGFKVGISHRNRDRAAQLRRQADSLDRVADVYNPSLYPYQEAGRDYWTRHGPGSTYSLPGSVRAGVRGWSAEESKRPTFTVDLGHDRRGPR